MISAAAASALHCKPWPTTTLLRLIRCDLRSPKAFDELPSPVDRVYHLAGVVGVDRVNVSPFDTLAGNVRITLNTVEWFLQCAAPGARLLVASSSEVVAGGVQAWPGFPIPTPESAPVVFTRPYSFRQSYGLSKLFGELLAVCNQAQSGPPMFSIRYHNVYGPDMGVDHAIPQIIERIHRRQSPFEIVGATDTRSFCWIDDAVRSTCLLMEATGIEGGSVINVGDRDGEIAMRCVYDMLFEICGWRPERVFLREAAADSVARRCPDTHLLEKLVGPFDFLPLKEGLTRTAAWYLRPLS